MRRLVEKDGQGRDIGVPFDEGRSWAEPLQNLVEQGPNRAADAAAVVVDQDRRAVIEHVPGMPGQMKLSDRLAGQFVQPVGRVELEIVRRDGHVVDVEQQAASAPAHEFVEELCLGQGGVAEAEICRRVLDGDLSPQSILQATDVAGDDVQRLLRVGQWQQVIEVTPLETAPRQMLRYQCRLQSVDESGDLVEMRFVDAIGRPKRQSDRVHRELEVVPQAQYFFERRRGTQAILRMHFEKYRTDRGLEQFVEMLGAKTDAYRGKHVEVPSFLVRFTRGWGRRHCRRPHQFDAGRLSGRAVRPDTLLASILLVVVPDLAVEESRRRILSIELWCLFAAMVPALARLSAASFTFRAQVAVTASHR